MFQHSLISQVEEVLPSVCKKNSEEVLEGRNKIIGGSEIGGCPLKAILSKRYPTEPDVPTLWHYLRGHTREVSLDLVHVTIAKRYGWKLTNQVRVYHPQNRGLRVHIDRVYSNGETLEISTQMLIVEEKCSAVIPDTPWDSWIEQLQFQIGLLQHTYPQAEVRGSVYATDLSGAHSDYGVKFSYNDTIYKRLVKKGNMMLKHLLNGTDPLPTESMLCGFCAYKLTHCPKFRQAPQITSDEVMATVEELGEITKQVKTIQKRQKEIKFHLRKMLTSQDQPRFKGKIGEKVVSISRRNGRVTCDLMVLEDQFPDAYAQTRKNGNDYTVVEVI